MGARTTIRWTYSSGGKSRTRDNLWPFLVCCVVMYCNGKCNLAFLLQSNKKLFPMFLSNADLIVFIAKGTQGMPFSLLKTSLHSFRECLEIFGSIFERNH